MQNWGSAPVSAGVAYSTPPDLLVGFKGPTSKAWEGEQKRSEGRAWDHENAKANVSRQVRSGKVTLAILKLILY